MTNPTIQERAWDVLEEGERPFGMRWNKHGPWDIAEPGHTMQGQYADALLIVAVEDVLLEAGWMHNKTLVGHVWKLTLANQYGSECRLAACVMALESMRSKP